MGQSQECFIVLFMLKIIKTIAVEVVAIWGAEQLHLKQLNKDPSDRMRNKYQGKN